MDTLYKAITDEFAKAATKAKFTDNNLPAPRTIDIHLGQPDNPQGFEIFYPAMFINWGDGKPSENESLVLELELHVIQEPGAGTEGFSTRIPEGLAYIRVLKTIQAILTGLRASNTTALRYVGKRPNITPFYRYHILQFRCFIDEIGEIPTTDVELEDYNPTFNIKQKEDEELPGSIETY